MQSTTSSRSSSSPIPATRRSCTCDPCRPSASTRASTTSALSKTTGNRLPWAPGVWAGKSGWMGRRSPSSPTSSRPAASARPGFGRDHLRPGPHRHRPAEGAAVSARSTGTERITSGDVNLQGEQEHSKYYFEVADVDRTAPDVRPVRGRSRSCPGRGLVLPAHDYILKCSHTFNILDTRGAVGVTERQALFGRMRELSRRISEAYLEPAASARIPLAG